MKFRMSKISSEILNDITEKDILDNIWKDKIFIACFTNSMNDYFWENYAKGKKQGVCIEIDMEKFKYNKILSEKGIILGNKTDYSYDNENNEIEWIIYDISGLEVVYKDNPSLDYYYDENLICLYGGCVDINKDDFRYYNNQGYSKKSDEWGQENEYRIRCAVRPKGQETYIKGTRILYHRPDFEFLFIDLSNQEDAFKIIINKEFELLDEIQSFCKSKGINLEII